MAKGPYPSSLLNISLHILRHLAHLPDLDTLAGYCCQGAQGRTFEASFGRLKSPD